MNLSVSLMLMCPDDTDQSSDNTLSANSIRSRLLSPYRYMMPDVPAPSNGPSQYTQCSVDLFTRTAGPNERAYSLSGSIRSEWMRDPFSTRCRAPPEGFTVTSMYVTKNSTIHPCIGPSSFDGLRFVQESRSALTQSIDPFRNQ